MYDECWHYNCDNCSMSCGCRACYGQACHNDSKPDYNPYEDDWMLKDDVLKHYCHGCIAADNDFDFDTPAVARAASAVQRWWRGILLQLRQQMP